MSTLTQFARHRDPHPPSALAGMGVALLLILGMAVLIVSGRVQIAVLLIFAPTVVLLFDRSRLVFGAVIAVLTLTLILGRFFASINVGPVYVLEATLVGVVVLALPAIVNVARRYPLPTSIVALYVSVTALQVLRSGVSIVVLRQSVLGLYAMWAVVGIALAHLGFVATFARAALLGAVGSTVVLGLSTVWPSNPITAPLGSDIVSVAQSLYVGYGLLLLLLLPELNRRRIVTQLLVILQLAVIVGGLVRSVWVALPLALLMTLLICGVTPRIRWNLVVLLGAGVSVLVLLAAVIRPSVIHSLRDQAASIVNYSGKSVADANARWRLTNWHYATQQIAAHPIAGIGFGGPEVPPSVCYLGCNDPRTAPDPTVVAGADLHNSILAIPLRMGLPALALLIAFEAAVLASARRYRRLSGGLGRWLLACHLLTGFTALTSVVLEGPYMGIFFWLFGGLVIGYQGRSEPSRVIGQPRSWT